MGDLLSRLDRELYRVAHEVRSRETGARGLLTLKSGLEGVDIYAHPSALMHFKRELEPFVQFEIKDPKKMPRNAFGKYRDCWVFADADANAEARLCRPARHRACRRNVRIVRTSRNAPFRQDLSQVRTHAGEMDRWRRHGHSVAITSVQALGVALTG